MKEGYQIFIQNYFTALIDLFIFNYVLKNKYKLHSPIRVQLLYFVSAFLYVFAMNARNLWHHLHILPYIGIPLLLLIVSTFIIDAPLSVETIKVLSRKILKFCIILLSIHYIGVPIICYAFHISKEAMVLGTIEYLIAKVMLSSFLIIIFYFMKKLKQNKLLLKSKHSVTSTLYALVILLLINMELSMILQMHRHFSGYFIYFLLFLILIYLSIVALFGYMENNLTKQKQICNEQQEYIQNIETILSGYRRMKHGYKNHIFALSGYIKNKNFEGLTQYFDIFLNESADLMKDNLSTITKIKNHAIFGMLALKINHAEQIKINMNIIINQDITFDQLDHLVIYDLNFILGNFLDNAILATLKADTPYIILSVEQNEEALIFEIKNTYTHSQNKNLRFDSGKGLQIIDETLKKYSFMINNHRRDETFFTQELILQMPNNKKTLIG